MPRTPPQPFGDQSPGRSRGFRCNPRQGAREEAGRPLRQRPRIRGGLAKAFESRAAVPSEATILPTIIHQDRRDTTSPPPGWEPARLRALEELLAPYVGPMARVLVKRSAKTTTDGPTLVRLLSESVLSERDGKAFAAEALEKVFAIGRREAAPDQSS